MKNRTEKTLILVESALVIALSTVLGMVKIFNMPQGGAITLASMAPLVVLSFRRGAKWAVPAAITHSLLQMLLGFSVPPAKSFQAFVLVILLDYVIAFMLLGLASVFGKVFKNRTAAIIFGTTCACTLRLLCSVLSGILVWAEYAPKDIPVWLYSLGYNASYMLPETILTIVVALVLIRVLDKTNKKV